MSNHGGSYMLNEIIGLMEQNGIFGYLGSEKSRHFLKDMIGISRDYDCNSGEILEGIGEKFRICYSCLNYAEDFEEGLCKNCVESFR